MNKNKIITKIMYIEAEELYINEILDASPLCLKSEISQCDPEYGKAIPVTITFDSLVRDE